MEVEIRAKINNLKAFLVNLNELKGIKEKEMHVRQVDTYIKHSKDIDRKLIFRLRRKKTGNLLTLKTHSSEKNDIAWIDIDIPIEDPDKFEDILMNSDYEYVVLIDKIRDSFQWNKYEINIDNVRELGYYVEIEKIVDSKKEIDKERKTIIKLLLNLGIDEIIEKGYVPLMLEKKKA